MFWIGLFVGVIVASFAFVLCAALKRHEGFDDQYPCASDVEGGEE